MSIFYFQIIEFSKSFKPCILVAELSCNNDESSFVSFAPMVLKELLSFSILYKFKNLLPGIFMGVKWSLSFGAIVTLNNDVFVLLLIGMFKNFVEIICIFDSFLVERWVFFEVMDDVEFFWSSLILVTMDEVFNFVKAS